LRYAALWIAAFINYGLARRTFCFITNFTLGAVVITTAFHAYIELTSKPAFVFWVFSETVATVGTRTILCALYAHVIQAGIGAFAIVIDNTINTLIQSNVFINKADAVCTVSIKLTFRAVVGVGIFIFIVDRYTNRLISEKISTIGIVFTVIALLSYGQALSGRTGGAGISAKSVCITHSRAIAEIFNIAIQVYAVLVVRALFYAAVVGLIAHCIYGFCRTRIECCIIYCTPDICAGPRALAEIFKTDAICINFAISTVSFAIADRPCCLIKLVTFPACTISVFNTPGAFLICLNAELADLCALVGCVIAGAIYAGSLNSTETICLL
jgi:hypothetical protein